MADSSSTDEDERLLDDKAALLRPESAQEAKAGFGGKTISFLGGACLVINNIIGPGCVALSLMVYTGGWFMPGFLILFLGLLSLASSLLMCQAMERVPGNEGFRGRVEFTNLAKHYLPRWAFWVSLVSFMVLFQATNILAIVESAQTMDRMLIRLAGGTCALRFSPTVTIQCIAAAVSTADSPFGNALVISLGFVVIMGMVIPLGFLNLDDNIKVQIGAVALTVIITAEWGLQCISHGTLAGWQPVPAFTERQGAVIGTVLFNFSYNVTIPSWVNEKKPDVSVHRTLTTAMGVGVSVYLLLAFTGGFAYVYHGQDLLSILTSSKVWYVTNIVAFVFPVSTLLSTIPVYSILIRYNLLENKICGKTLANLFGVILPWPIAVLFYNGNTFTVIMNWVSLFVSVPINFLVPCAAFLACQRQQQPWSATSVLPGQQQQQQQQQQQSQQPQPLDSAESGSCSSSVAAPAAATGHQQQGEGAPRLHAISLATDYGSTSAASAASAVPASAHSGFLDGEHGGDGDGDAGGSGGDAGFRAFPPAITRVVSARTITLTIMVVVSVLNLTALVVAIARTAAADPTRRR